LSYTCNDYRLEMVLLGLRLRLADAVLTADERQALERQVRDLEERLGMDAS